jgi:endonuclease YncB( thermonuclease family)
VRFTSAILIGIVLSVFASPVSKAESILKITDGDTIRINTGEDVRLLQIDTPEPMSAECYAAEATQALTKLISGKTIRLESDPVSDNIDQYKRLLRYVFVGKLNVNLRMVEIGAAAPYFYQGEKGIYSAAMLKAARNAKFYKVGLWKTCPGTQLVPTKAITTYKAAGTPVASSVTAPSPSTGCDPNYAGCIPLFPPDLNCGDIKALGLAPVTVLGKDPHRLDGDGDGKACTS